MKQKRSKRRRTPRNGVLWALILQGNISRLSGKFIAPRRGRGAGYDRKAEKNVEVDR